MTIRDVREALSATLVCGDEAKVFDGVYVGDLLSRAMSRVRCNNLWITIMSNTNVIAVATLTEPCAIILAEDVVLQPDAKKSAEENGITVLTSPLSAYEICTCLDRAEKGI